MTHQLQQSFSDSMVALVAKPEARAAIVTFLDTASTSFGRATHYNTRDEQQAAELAAHVGLQNLHRGLYATLLTLPGLTDRAVQLGVRNLLSCPPNGHAALSPAVERQVIEHLFAELPIQRLLKVMQSFRTGDEALGIRKANNSRTRKLILRTLLGSDKLELWAVKYRHKMRDALTHAWSQRTASILRTVATKPFGKRSQKENAILHRHVWHHTYPTTNHIPSEDITECVAFILGAKVQWSLPLLIAHEAAKTDLAAGSKLPLEVLHGIRSTYHKAIPAADLLKVIDKKTLSANQRMAVQRKAKEVGAEITMDPMQYDAVRLYLYAYEMGMTDEIVAALDRKAKTAAQSFPLRYDHTAILVDASASMAGSKEQPLRPMATALAIRDVLRAASGRDSTVLYAGGGGLGMYDDRLVRPAGDTALAADLVRLLTCKPDAVFVISDGYENCSAGRLAEVVSHIRAMNITTPIYHLNPVMAAESDGARSLGANTIATIPVQRPDAFGVSMLREVFRTDPALALSKLLQATIVPKLLAA